MQALPAFLPRLVIGLACLVGTVAIAQWQWLDKDGRKVFSDRAPPNDIPVKNILKRPGGAKAAATAAVDTNAADTNSAASGGTTNAAKAADTAAAAAAGATGAVAQNAAAVPKLSGVDKDLEQKKKQAADADAAKRRAEEERTAKAKLDNCTRAKQSKASLESGVRLARTNEKGEREFMDDAAKAAESKRVQGIIDASCN